ncbi:unnamed protein product [Callosobruchus maculatus]|nr:unnamed protein product [Callosobruchus maculatus]
MSGQLGF